MMSLSIRDLTIEDVSEAVELNEAVVALTSPMDAERYATLCFHTSTGIIPSALDSWTVENGFHANSVARRVTFPNRMTSERPTAFALERPICPPFVSFSRSS